MTTRAYTLGKRQTAVNETRGQIIAAARDALGANTGEFSFKIDTIARAAGVARMTVYHNFASRAGLLEALFDDLAERGGISRRLPAAFAQPEPLAALNAFVEAYGHFWSTDRLLLRRLHAIAILDPEIGAGHRAREERRRTAARVILGRVADQYDQPIPVRIDEAVDVLYTLTAFETFDTLAGPARTPRDVIPLIQQLTRFALGLHARGKNIAIGAPGG